MLHHLPVIENYDLSIIMPFYKKLKEFKRVFPSKSKYFARIGIEVIIVMDEPSEKAGLISFLQGYPEITWKVLVNEKTHPWRNPAFATNVGLRYATQKYVLVFDPELEFYSDLIFLLRSFLEIYDNHYSTGSVHFAEKDDVINESNIHHKFFIPYGSIMAKRSDLIRIGGYLEVYDAWGGEDNNIRFRLQMAGVKEINIPQARLVHFEEYPGENKERDKKQSKIPIAHLKEMLYPDKLIVNGEDWGTDFNKIEYAKIGSTNRLKLFT